MRYEHPHLIVEAHEWAWSLRTQGFPVYAITASGELVEVGETKKHVARYALPEGTVAVVRYYESVKGHVTLYVYTIPELREYRVEELEGFAVPEELKARLPQAALDAINKLALAHLD